MMKRVLSIKKTGFWYLVMTVFILELFFYAWCRVQTVRCGYEISGEANLQQKLTAYQNNLKIELARLKSPERIAGIARQQLGMIVPTADKTILLP